MSCLKCLKYTMCVVNLIFFICGAAIFGLGIYLMTTSKFAALLPSLQAMSIANSLFITGIIITCVSFLGFLGALKENRCLLISFFILLFILMLVELAVACILLIFEAQVDKYINSDLTDGLKTSISNRKENNNTKDDWDIVHNAFECCGINNASDWNSGVPESCCMSSACGQNDTKQYWIKGCYTKLKDTFENNLLNAGIGVIVVCVIEVLGMCFSMTLFCHISRSGLQYK
ncbi:leukocyte surface antigen CD53 [Triplophysa rosa]|uniref:Tetraspanin n=1 Tax=Triplophysa rosa TaxID=992332 RepID=A0A9W7X4J4_TRIRA|nr:leukocyte surface antigen CD53 [Triplophysa rosa]KAI7813620.1 leukocyte surface antigen CD53 [Triplophysa rosa]